MIKKVLNPLGAGAGALILAVASTASYLLGWLRDAIFVRVFGVTAATDSYFKAFLLPDVLLTLFITGALLGLVIPLYVQARKISEEEGAKAFGAFFTILNGVYALAAVCCLLFLGPILQFLFPETPLEQQEILRTITSILIISNFFFALSNFLGHFLLAHKRFFAYSFAPLFYNLGIIAGILLGHQTLGIYAAAYGALAGAFLHCGLRFLDFLFTTPKFTISWNWQNPFLQQLLRSMWPKVVALLSLQIGFYAFARMGDGLLGPGNYSAFQYARNLQSFAVSLFGISLATAVFPFLAEFVAEGKMERFIFRLEKSLRQILFLALPAALGIMLVAEPIVEVIYGIQEGNSLTIAVLIPIALAVPFESMNHLLVRAFHVLKNTFLPMISSLLFLVVLLGGSVFLLFEWEMGVMAFGMAYLAGFIVQTAFLFFWLPRLSQEFPWQSFFAKFGKTLSLTVLMSGIVYGMSIFLQDAGLLTRFLLPIGSGGIVFLGGAFLWKMPEVSEVPFTKWLKREK